MESNEQRRDHGTPSLMLEFWYVFAVGLLVGFGLSIPVGPINILCIQRTLAEGRRAGLISGLGAATSDAIYGIIAMVGLSLVSGYIAEHTVALRVIAGVALLLLGAKSLYDGYWGQVVCSSRGRRRHWIRTWASHAGAYLSTFVLTMTNPATLLALAAIFAALGLARRNLSHYDIFGLCTGVFIGATLWWCTVVLVVWWVRRFFRPERLMSVNKVSGVILTICGLAVLLSPLFLPPRSASSTNQGGSATIFQILLPPSG